MHRIDTQVFRRASGPQAPRNCGAAEGSRLIALGMEAFQQELSTNLQEILPYRTTGCLEKQAAHTRVEEMLKYHGERC